MEARVRTELDARLSAGIAAPVAIALSGGGDSLALLLLARDWARDHGRRILALTVDHGLQPASLAWAGQCAGLCRRLGVEHRVLTWRGPWPTSGLPAAARTARHALLAEACREAGAAVLMLGHTADDLAESAAMRADGSTVPDARAWAPSPAWPQGRGVFLCRPLLGVGRADLRRWLTARGETWIEDPANLDDRFARSRARKALAGQARDPGQADRVTPAPRSAEVPSAKSWGAEPWGALRLRREASGPMLAAASVCAAGALRPPRSARVERLLARLAGPGPVISTLAGARIDACETGILVYREPGELSRRPIAPAPLPPNGTVVFDGRFELAARAPGLRVLPLDGHAARLADPERAALKTLPPEGRRALPLVTDGESLWTCPILADSAFVSARSLVLKRFEAFLGHVVREADAHSVAERGEAAGGVLS
ncbi:MAG: tRNA lysidine(34) synthetase TilS [Caulobacter sp.]|nr:tRNA lysidine(34) synthetase TilS [Caulobacter sp.]